MTNKSPETKITTEPQTTPHGWPAEISLPTAEEYREILAAEKPEAIRRDPGVFVTFTSLSKRARRRIVNEPSHQLPGTD